MMLVPVKYLEETLDPMGDPNQKIKGIPWYGVKKAISRQEVVHAAAQKLSKPKEFNPFKAAAETRQDHINRIAYYFKHGWGDAPILILFKDEKNWNPLVDGFHRVAAAICRGDEMIQAEVRGPRHLIRQIYEFEEKMNNEIGATKNRISS